MARNMQPIAKRCKALNLSPAAMGYSKKNTNRNPKGQMRKVFCNHRGRGQRSRRRAEWI